MGGDCRRGYNVGCTWGDIGLAPPVPRQRSLLLLQSRNAQKSDSIRFHPKRNDSSPGMHTISAGVRIKTYFGLETSHSRTNGSGSTPRLTNYGGYRPFGEKIAVGECNHFLSHPSPATQPDAKLRSDLIEPCIKENFFGVGFRCRLILTRLGFLNRVSHVRSVSGAPVYPQNFGLSPCLATSISPSVFF